MGVRAGILVTGTEVLTGRVADRNGPWVADRLLELGVELAHITICGDRPADIGAQLRFLRDEDVDLIVTTGGLGPTADDMTVATRRGLLRPGPRPGCRDGGPDRRDRAEVDVAVPRYGPRRRAGRQPQAGHGSRGCRRAGSGGYRTGRGGARPPDGRGAARSAEGIAGDVAGRGRDGCGATGHRRAHRLPSGHRADVRGGRVRPRRHTAGRRGSGGLRCPGDHHLPAPGRSGDGDPLRARRRRRLPRPDGSRPRPARGGRLLRGRLDRRRPGRRTACRPAHRHRGILHRRDAGRPADRPGRVVGVRDRWGGGLRQRGQGGHARGRPGADRRARSGVQRGGRGHGCRGIGPLRCGHGRGDHRSGRARAAARPRNRSARCGSVSRSATDRR